MVSYELLIRSNLNLMLCWIFLALNLAYSPREIPEMQRNCSPTLCCLLLLELARSGSLWWLGLEQLAQIIPETSQSWGWWIHPSVGTAEEQDGCTAVFESSWSWQVLAIRSVYLFPICWSLFALHCVHWSQWDAPARYSAVHPRELSSLMSREGQPTQEL